METEQQKAPADGDAVREIEDTPSQATDAEGDAPGPATQERGGESDLAAALAAAEARAKKAEEDYLYAQAEIENSKKRFARQADERLAHAHKRLVAKFLPVLDNLQRALSFENDSAGLRGGLNATLRGFETLLQSENAQAIDVLHKPFDPRFAEAISTRDTSEHDDGVVVEEVQRGYTLGEEVLRPALVVVANRVEKTQSPGGAAGS